MHAHLRCGPQRHGPHRSSRVMLDCNRQCEFAIQCALSTQLGAHKLQAKPALARVPTAMECTANASGDEQLPTPVRRTDAQLNTIPTGPQAVLQHHAILAATGRRIQLETNTVQQCHCCTLERKKKSTTAGCRPCIKFIDHPQTRNQTCACQVGLPWVRLTWIKQLKRSALLLGAALTV